MVGNRVIQLVVDGLGARWRPSLLVGERGVVKLVVGVTCWLMGRV